ncbi:MAG: SUMF1/EgtB/PvdO family nonheme iron enzyme [Gammaproteobacteria bacterium]|nr:SUMF1/EgtB/PvdO family nonheme iron enzyme [Gammaproteobacteria bacterium]
MSKFNRELARARARSRRTGAAVALAVAVVAVAAAVFFVYTRGIAVSVSPAAAAASAVVGIARGVGFAVGGKVYSAGDVTITVAAPGFITETVDVAAGRRGNLVEVVMREAPSMLLLAASPALPETRWFVDGALVASGAGATAEVKPGMRRVRADHPHHEVATFTVNIKRGEEVSRTVNLARLSGRLHVTTVPPGATVTMDGATAGTAPLAIDVGGGSHALTVTLAGRKTVRDTVTVTNAAPAVTRNYNLPPLDATVRFALSPAGGTLLVNGRRIRNTDAVTVTAGREHTAAYAKPGHGRQVRKFTAAAGASNVVRMTLRAETGEVKVTSTPPATVTVDGTVAGATPLDLRLSTAPHTITLSKPNYRSVTRTVTPSTGGVKRVDAVLKTEMQARLEESPALYKNHAGMTMKLFARPGAVNMGAPRHEKGRRANEFERAVRLARPFYVALHETTVAQFGLFQSGKAGPPTAPVTNVAWADAAAFCNWLSAREGLQPFYARRNGGWVKAGGGSDGYRLPSEAEWEYLARKAGRPQQTRFTWGDQAQVPPRAGNFADESAKGKTASYIPRYTDGFAGLAPVGSFPADRAGLFDLSGNASEWVHDVYSLTPPRDSAIEVDPMGAAHGGAHVFKGSNWRSASLTELRASFRETSAGGRDDLGFRVARYLYGGNHAAQ